MAKTVILKFHRFSFSVSAFRNKRFLIHHVWHFRWIAAVVTFEDVDKSLNAAASHAFIGIDREARDSCATGKMMEHATAICDFKIKQWRIRRQRFLLEHI